MKIHLGFISNSSSSSFCILGIYFDNEDAAPKYNFDRKLIEAHSACNDGDDSFYLGTSPERMRDDETLLQFKERIATALTEGGFPTKPEDLNWFTDGGYNG